MKVQRFEKAASLLSFVDKIEDNSDKAFLNKSSTVIKEEEVNGAHTDHEDDFLQAEWEPEALIWGVVKCSHPALFVAILPPSSAFFD